MGEEIMKFKKIMFVGILLLAIFAIGAVSASDVNETAIAINDEQVIEEMISSDNDNSLQYTINNAPDEPDNTTVNYSNTKSSEDEFEVLSANSIDDLSSLIEDTPDGGTLELNNDYELERDSKFTVSKAITIDGKNHVISGNTIETLFTITNSNAILKNIIFKESYPNIPLINGGTLENCSFINFYRKTIFTNGTAYNCNFINCTGESSPVDNAFGIYNCTFINCQGAVSETPVYNCTFMNCHSSYGGAVYFYHYSTNSNVNDSRFINCSATSNGGAIYYSPYYSNKKQMINNCSFVNCSVPNGGNVVNCNVLMCNFINCIGSCIDNGNAFNSTFKNTFSTIDGAGIHNGDSYNSTFINCSSSDNGGAIYNGNSYDSRFINCSATLGGAIYVIEKRSVNNSYFENCNANEDGGAVCGEYYGMGYKSYVYNSKFVNCSAVEFGGAFYGGVVYNSSFANCHANRGGAVSVSNVYNSSFEDTYADIGGAIYNGNCYDSKFINCSATGDGGAIYNPNSGTIENSSFYECFSGNNAGAIYCYSGNANGWGNVNNCTFINCHSENEAGAIHYAYVKYSRFENSTSKNGFALSSSSVYKCNFTDCYAGYATLVVKVKNVSEGENATIDITLSEQADGTASITVNDKPYDINITEGEGSLTVSDLPKGEYTVNVTCNVNGYLVASQTASFEVKEMYETNITLTTEKRLIPGSGKIIVLLDERINGSVIVKNEYMNKNVEIINGKGEFTLTNLEEGVEYVTIIFDGNSDFSPKTVTTSFKVYANPNIRTTISKSLCVGDDIRFTIKIDSESYSSSNYLNIRVSQKNNIVKEQNISQWGDSNPYPNMGKLDAGEYELVISYDGYGIYGASQLTETFKILENPNIVIGVSNITYGQTAQVNISINENITGDLEVEVDNVNKNIELLKGKGTLYLSDLTVGTHKVEVTFWGDDTFAYRYATASFNVAEIKTVEPNVIIPSMDNISANSNVEIIFPTDAIGGVIFTVNSKNYSCDVNAGKAIITIPSLDNGEYDYTLKYLGDTRYSPVTRFGVVKINNGGNTYDTNTPGENTTKPDSTVTVDPKITASNLNTVYTSGSAFKVSVYGTDGKLASGVSVVIKVNGKTVATVKTVNGIATYKTTQTPGTYKISATALDKILTKTLTVKHLITLKSVSVKKSAKKLVIQASLVKVNSKYLKSKKITFKFNGKKYTAKTNAKGVAKLTIKSSVLKKLKVGKKVTYQATYLKDTVKKTAKIKK